VELNRNVEIKARVANLGELEERVRRLAAGSPKVLHQEDTFFQSQRGRLKLRKITDAKGELIFYDRPDSLEPVESRYALAPTSSPDSLKGVLSRSAGVIGVVRKKRLLYLIGQTRVHLDRVEGLGEFVELEVVLRPDQDCEEGVSTAKGLMKDLGIPDEALVKNAYIDMLTEGTSGVA
jgi:adenylate cyclase